MVLDAAEVQRMWANAILKGLLTFFRAILIPVMPITTGSMGCLLAILDMERHPPYAPYGSVERNATFAIGEDRKEVLKGLIKRLL